MEVDEEREVSLDEWKEMRERGELEREESEVGVAR
jgi:hypothetical protein